MKHLLSVAVSVLLAAVVSGCCGSCPVKCSSDQKAASAPAEKTGKKTASACPKQKSGPSKAEPKPTDKKPAVVSDLNLRDITWVLDLNSMNGVEKSWQKPERPIDFRINAQGQVAGCAGVNRYFGPASIGGNNGISFQTLGSTRMAGLGMKYEDLYLKILGGVDSYRIENGMLLFLSKGNVVARFSAKANGKI